MFYKKLNKNLDRVLLFLTIVMAVMILGFFILPNNITENTDNEREQYYSQVKKDIECITFSDEVTCQYAKQKVDLKSGKKTPYDYNFTSDEEYSCTVIYDDNNKYIEGQQYICQVYEFSSTTANNEVQDFSDQQTSPIRYYVIDENKFNINTYKEKAINSFTEKIIETKKVKAEFWVKITKFLCCLIAFVFVFKVIKVISDSRKSQKSR